MDEMSTAQDWDGWSNLNYAFHRRLHELSGKRHHVRLVTQVLNVVEPYSRIYVHMLSSLGAAQQEHHAMLDAVAARDADRLRTLFETSIRTTRDRLIAEMPTGEEGPDPLDRLLDQGA